MTSPLPCFIQAPLPTALRVAMVAACLFGLLLTLVVGLRLAASGRSLLVSALSSLVVSLGVLVYLRLRLPPESIPITWLRVLHEGNSETLFEATFSTTHAGPGFRALVEAYTPDGVLMLRGAAHLNLCLTAACVGLLFPIGHYVLGARLPALVLSALYVANVQTLSVATSELPTVVLQLCFLAGVVGFEAIRREGELRRTWGALGQVLLSVAAAVACLCRTEALLIAGPALALSWLQRSRPNRIDALHAGLARAVRRLLTAPRYVLLLAALVTFSARAIDVGTEASWIAQALSPLDPGFLLYPVLLAQLVPLGFVVLFVLGWVHCCRRAAYFALAPLTIPVLFKLYEAAGHQVTFEVVRYTSAIATAAFWLALFGWRELQGWAERWKWPKSWSTLAILSLCLISTLLPLRVDGALATPLNRDHQLAAQLLVETIEKHPHCTMVTKHVDRTGKHATYVFFGAHQAPAQVPADLGLEGALGQVTTNENCALFYYGLDCNRTELPCRTEADAHRETWRMSQPSRPYSDRGEYGEHVGELTFATFAIRGPVAPN